MALSAPDRTRLVGILGMLASDHDGERASAALLASRMVKARGLTWVDLIGTPTLPPPREAAPSGWRTDLALAQRHASFLRTWEQGFVVSLGTRATITPKQRVVLTEIATALRARNKT